MESNWQVNTQSGYVTQTDIQSYNFPVWSGYRLVLRLTLMHICGVLAVGMNVLNLIILRRVTCFNDATKLFLRLLALVDMMSGLLNMVTENVVHWSKLEETFPFFCEITFTLTLLLIFSSMFLLSCLSIDRILAISKPLRYISIMNKTKTVCMATCAICLALLVSVAILSRFSPLDNVYFDRAYLFCSIKKFDSDIQFALIMGGTMAILMICLTTIINLKLLWISCKQSRRQRIILVHPLPAHQTVETAERLNETNPQRSQISIWREIKALRTVLVMTVTLYVAFLPLTIHAVRYGIGLTSYGEVYEFFCYLMAFSNAWFNPVIYLFLNKSYREKAYLLFGLR